MLIEKTIKETSWISPINNATYNKLWIFISNSVENCKKCNKEIFKNEFTIYCDIGKVFYCLECGNDMNKCLYLNRFIIERRNKKIHNHTIGKLLIR